MRRRALINSAHWSGENPTSVTGEGSALAGAHTIESAPPE
ncbi:MAG: hypothetical protein QOC83_449 [Pseudonocardiales bacterium]|nr:hypothetical protein [Pseudonocardiales bacterium]MDT7747460.1 hypothetical protein [Pseudonocardiales bacterium]